MEKKHRELTVTFKKVVTSVINLLPNNNKKISVVGIFGNMKFLQ